MAAIAEAAGARYAPRWAMRALLRVVMLGGLIVVGWLLGAGTGHADEDPGLPGRGPIHIVNATIVDGESSGRADAQTAVGRGITRVLSAASAPQLPIQPPVNTGILRPIVDTVGLPKPLSNVLAPVSRPLSGTGPHTVTSRLPAQADPLETVLPAVPESAPAASTTSTHTAVLTLVPLRHSAPAVPLCSSVQFTAEPVIVQTAVGDDLPVDPLPAGPPGSGTSACLVNGAASSASTKNAPDVAVHNGGAMAHPASPSDLSSRDTSDLPPSLSAQPSTSPD